MAARSKFFSTVALAGEKTLLWDADQISAQATSLIIQNQHATDTLWIGGADVAMNNGVYILAGGSITTETPRQRLYGFPAAGHNIRVGILQEFRDF